MKEKILQTSLNQFLKYGIRGMSIQRLVEPFGILTKTVYKYFKNKEELLKEALNLFHTQHYQILENLPLKQNVAPSFLTCGKEVWTFRRKSIRHSFMTCIIIIPNSKEKYTQPSAKV